MTLDIALVEPMIATLESLFSEEETDRIARRSGFVERSTSRLSGRMFLMMNVLRAEGHLYKRPMLLPEGSVWGYTEEAILGRALRPASGCIYESMLCHSS